MQGPRDVKKFWRKDQVREYLKKMDGHKTMHFCGGVQNKNEEGCFLTSLMHSQGQVNPSGEKGGYAPIQSKGHCPGEFLAAQDRRDVRDKESTCSKTVWCLVARGDRNKNLLQLRNHIEFISSQKKSINCLTEKKIKGLTLRENCGHQTYFYFSIFQFLD